MRIFRHWVIEPFSATLAGVEYTAKCFGGSNISAMEAKADAFTRFEAVKRRILGVARQSEYLADILEEPLQTLNPQNIVTRNRYGAEVLNSTDHIFIDIDKPPGRFWDLFKRPEVAERKSRILCLLNERRKKSDMTNIGLRIYETTNGIRVILSGIVLSPSSKECQELLKSFSCDSLYAVLCRRQGCFRARLSPKPHRINVKRHKVCYPRLAGSEAALQKWLLQYQQAQTGYATCRFVQSYGVDGVDEVIEFHDKRTEAFSIKPLA